MTGRKFATGRAVVGAADEGAAIVTPVILPERCAAQIEPIRDLAVGIRGVLDGSGYAARAQARAIETYVTTCGIRWEAARVCEQGRTIGCTFTMHLPGATAAMMVSRPEPVSHSITAFGNALRTIAAAHRRNGAKIVQSIVETSDDARRHLMPDAGFQRMTRLHYMSRDVVHPWIEIRTSTPFEWRCYSSEVHTQFAATLHATYIESADCPELGALRSADDALASHRASGKFDARLWELALLDGIPVGCLLITRLVHAPIIELTYMGVVNSARRRGIGRALLNRFFEKARQSGLRSAALVVDDRNRAAKHLYERFGFSSIALRDAYLHS